MELVIWCALTAFFIYLAGYLITVLVLLATYPVLSEELWVPLYVSLYWPQLAAEKLVGTK